jgi:hypothetical protein
MLSEVTLSRQQLNLINPVTFSSLLVTSLGLVLCFLIWTFHFSAIPCHLGQIGSQQGQVHVEKTANTS